MRREIPSRLTEALVRAQQHWDEHHHQRPEEDQPGWTIAISRQSGADATRIAQAVGKRLGWAVYDNELVEHIAKNHNLRVKLLKRLDEKQTSWLEESVEHMSSAPPIGSSAYVHYLVETLLSLGKHGHCVIVGRGASMVLPAETTLRVRLVGPLHERVRGISERLGIDKQEAAAWVDKTDRERTRFVIDHFHKDPREVELYDLVLNSTRFGVEWCADAIVHALKTAQASRTKATPVRA